MAARKKEMTRRKEERGVCREKEEKERREKD